MGILACGPVISLAIETEIDEGGLGHPTKASTCLTVHHLTQDFGTVSCAQADTEDRAEKHDEQREYATRCFPWLGAEKDICLALVLLPESA